MKYLSLLIEQIVWDYNNMNPKSKQAFNIIGTIVLLTIILNLIN